MAINGKICLFGGFAREPFNDTRIITCEDYYNEERYYGSVFENIGEEGINFPQKRFGHSFSLYKGNQGVVFGGGGAYNQQAKLRLTFNDVKIFDTCKFSIIDNFVVSKTWETDNFIIEENGDILQEAPKRRMHHAADVYGCMLVVHGGFSGEEKLVLNDFAIYDLSKNFELKFILDREEVLGQNLGEQEPRK